MLTGVVMCRRSPASTNIDMQLIDQQLEELFKFKILLLGAGESGQATVTPSHSPRIERASTWKRRRASSTDKSHPFSAPSLSQASPPS